MSKLITLPHWFKRKGVILLLWFQTMWRQNAGKFSLRISERMILSKTEIHICVCVYVYTYIHKKNKATLLSGLNWRHLSPFNSFSALDLILISVRVVDFFFLNEKTVTLCLIQKFSWKFTPPVSKTCYDDKFQKCFAYSVEKYFFCLFLKGFFWSFNL